MQTELELPRQEKPSRGGFPTTPSGVRKWLDQLGQVDVREATKRFIQGVHALNRLEMAPAKRLENMELLRPMGREVLDHLGGRIQANTLPLPERTRRVFELNVRLLTEIALGYDIVLTTLTHSRWPGTGSRIALAAERALAARGELMLRSSQVYSPLPSDYWQRTHTVFARAEAAGAAERSVRDPQVTNGRGSVQKPMTMYKRLLMFAVAQTEGLRKSEIERVYKAVATWALDAQLRAPDQRSEGVPGSADADSRFAMDLAASGPPLAWHLHPGGDPSTLRVLDLRPLIPKLEREYEAGLEAERSEEALDPGRISATALRRLLENWQQRAVRRAERASHGERVPVEVTLARIQERLVEENRPKRPQPSEQTNSTDTTGLSLQTIERNDEPPDEAFITHPGMGGESPSDSVWDEVGRGRARSKGFVEAKREAERADEDDGPDAVHWILEDSSQTGFRLHWVGEGSSRATVGELIAARVATRGGGEPRWRMGVVRWIRFVGEAEFMAGCAALSMHMSPASVRRDRAKRKARAQKPSEPSSSPALLLPGHRAKGQAAGIILPAHIFHEGETVKLEVRDRTLRVQLAHMREHSGAFMQFDLAPARKSRPSTESSKRSVWDAL
jgi:hypothetical protein